METKYYYHYYKTSDVSEFVRAHPDIIGDTCYDIIQVKKDRVTIGSWNKKMDDYIERAIANWQRTNEHIFNRMLLEALYGDN